MERVRDGPETRAHTGARGQVPLPRWTHSQYGMDPERCPKLPPGGFSASFRRASSRETTWGGVEVGVGVETKTRDAASKGAHAARVCTITAPSTLALLAHRKPTPVVVQQYVETAGMLRAGWLVASLLAGSSNSGWLAKPRSF